MVSGGGGGNELAETQIETKAVKQALKEGTAYLGMQGETLQRYLLQLGQKEFTLLSIQLQGATVSGQRAAPHQLMGSSAPPTPSSAAAFVGTDGGMPAAGMAVAAAAGNASIVKNGFQNAPAAESNGEPSQPSAPRLQPREPPPGPPKAFDKKNLDQVLVHMCDYEALPSESTIALRCLSSLAYADAAFNVEDSRVLSQLLRLLTIHEAEPQVQLAGMRVLCNVAYDPDTALKHLAEPKVFGVILKAMEGSPAAKDLPVKASEAAARIVAAEVCPVGEAVTDGGPARTVVEDEPKGLGVVAGFFAVSISGESGTHKTVLQLVSQLIANEVIQSTMVADRFIFSASAVQGALAGTSSAVGWLSVAKLLTGSAVPGLADALVSAGAIAVAARLMEGQADDAAVQLAGIEAMSQLIGNRWAGLEAFAQVQGVTRIESAMRTHVGKTILQTKGIRALACGIHWPAEIQTKSGYTFSAGVELTKEAMVHHCDDVELQIAGLEALAKYLDKLHCKDEVTAKGGEGLVKAQMARHAQVQKVQTWGRIVLDGIGVDRGWVPKGLPAAPPP